MDEGGGYKPECVNRLGLSVIIPQEKNPLGTNPPQEKNSQENIPEEKIPHSVMRKKSPWKKPPRILSPIC